jgi:hypothetical protein
MVMRTEAGYARLAVISSLTVKGAERKDIETEFLLRPFWH